VSLTLSGWLADQGELPESDLYFLLRQRLGMDRAGLVRYGDEPLKPDILDMLSADVARLYAGEPLAYVLGEWSFWDFDLTVTPAVLIPRPETETLVEAALERVGGNARALDLGTGSGAIAIALARAGLDVVAVDESPSALEIASGNAARLKACVTFAASDWFSAVSGPFDLIVANPPYVAEADSHLPALSHEPVDALVSGPEGLDDLERIITRAPGYLGTGGWLLVEHGYDQEPAVRELFARAGFQAIECRQDLAGQPRVTLGRQGPSARPV
jgi:release factor glutamine methyltransferase